LSKVLQKNADLIVNHIYQKYQSNQNLSDMAAQMAAIRGHSATRAASTEESVESDSAELPAEKDREFDIELGLLTLNG
jgi:hypothetical protein